MASREIRVFLSSTFNDMHPERDYLVKRTFPRLRNLAAKRGVTLTEVDLRWGITESESKEGKTLAICLDEIINSHPFFIGLLGNRYGWAPTPEELGSDAIPERYNWVSKDLSEGMSITELEMQFGVLRNPDDIYATFHIRKGGKDDDVKQTKLKEAVRNQTRYKVAEYADPEELGEQVEANFKELLDRLYPEDDADKRDSRRMLHLDYARVEARNYLPDPRIMSQTESFLSSATPGRLHVTGDSGSGKSALLSHIATIEEERGERHVIAHFAGAGEQTDAASLAEWLKEEIEKAPEGKPLLVIVDDAGAITGADSNADTSWISSLPDDVTLIVSSADGQPVTDLLRRDVPKQISVLPLLLSQHRQLAEKYFQSYRKKLTDEDYKLIVHPSRLFDNTLAYVTLLEELRCFGNFNRLPEYIARIASFSTSEDFYNFLLESKENFYASERHPEVVRVIMSLLVLSAGGLTESDLVVISGIPQMLVSQFLLGNTYLVKRHNGLLKPAHRRIAEVVTERYGLDTEEGADPLREKIINYFESDAAEEQMRDIELPYQYWKMTYLDELYHYICDFQYLRRCLDQNRHFFLRYWNTLLEYDSWFYRVDAYFDNPTKLPSIDDAEGPLSFLDNDFFNELHVTLRSDRLLQFANLLMVFLNSDQPVEMLCTRALNTISREESEAREPWISTLATIYGRRGDYGKALSLFSYALKSLNNKDMRHAHTLLHNIAETYLTIGDRTHRPYYYETAAQIQREVMNYRIDTFGKLNKDVAVAMSNLASALHELGEEKEAACLLEESTEIYRQLSGDADIDVAINISNECNAAIRSGNYQKALSLSGELIEILNQLSVTDTPHMIQAYFSRLQALAALNRKEEMPELIAKSLPLLHDSHSGIQKLMSLLNLIKIAKNNDLGESLNAIKEEILATGDLGNDAEAYNLRGKALAELHENDLALNDYVRAIDLYISKGNYIEAAKASGAAAHFLFLNGAPEKALEWFERAFSLMDEYSIDPDGNTAITWQNYAVVLFRQERVDDAIQAMRRACEIRNTLFGSDDRMLTEEYLPLLKQMEDFANSVSLTDAPPQQQHKDVARFLSLLGDTEEIDAEGYDLAAYYARAHEQFRRGSISAAISLYKSLLTKLIGLNRPIEAIAWVKRSLAYAYELDKSSSSQSYAAQYYGEALDEAGASASLLEAVAHDYAEFLWNSKNYPEALRIYTYQLKGAIRSVGFFDSRAMRCIGNMAAAMLQSGKDADLEFVVHCGSILMALAHAVDNEEYERWGNSLAVQALNAMGVDPTKYALRLPEDIAKVMEALLEMGNPSGALTMHNLYDAFGYRMHLNDEDDDAGVEGEDFYYLSDTDTSRRLYLEARLAAALGQTGYIDMLVYTINHLTDNQEEEAYRAELDVLYGLLAEASLECCDFNMVMQCYNLIDELSDPLYDGLLKAASMRGDMALVTGLLELYDSHPDQVEFVTPLAFALAQATARQTADVKPLEEMDLSALMELDPETVAPSDLVYIVIALHRGGEEDKARTLYRKIADMSYEDPRAELQRIYALCAYLKENGLQEEVDIYKEYASRLLPGLNGYEKGFFTNAFQNL